VRGNVISFLSPRIIRGFSAESTVNHLEPHLECLFEKLIKMLHLVHCCRYGEESEQSTVYYYYLGTYKAKIQTLAKTLNYSL